MNCRMWVLLLAVFGLNLAGCARGVYYLKPEEQTPIDRKHVEFPAGTELRTIITGLTAPSAIAFDSNGSLLIAESGIGGNKARIIGFKKTGEFFEVYPKGRRFPFQRVFTIYGPIGGMVAANGKIYVTHRDERGFGMITAFDYDGHYKVIVSDLPARGDHGMTDIAIAQDGRLYFGVGTATNSGVVGEDNLEWLREYRGVCDLPWSDGGSIYLRGLRFNTPNPFGGFFGGSDTAVTAPFQAFGQSIETRIPRAAGGKPNGAIYSMDPSGGPVKVEAHGIRYPVGLAFNEYNRLFMTNQGMKLHGTRPVKDDPDVLLKLANGQWYGWPDFSANLLPIQEPRFQPPQEMLVKSGYRELSFLIDHTRSGLPTPRERQANLLAAEFSPLSGAAKFDFIRGSGPLARFRQGRDLAIVALSGDRAPFDSGGLKLVGEIGHKLMLVNVDDGKVEEFIRNTREGPASTRPDTTVGLERPYDVKFGPDGALYILDFGQIESEGPIPKVTAGSGRVYRLGEAAEPATKPTEP